MCIAYTSISAFSCNNSVKQNCAPQVSPGVLLMEGTAMLSLISFSYKKTQIIDGV